MTYTSEIRFATKPQIALEQIRAAHAAGIAPGVIVADAAYGNTTSFRDEITEMGLQYILCVQSNTTAWPPGEAPLPPRKRKNRLGRPRTALRRTAQHAPVALAELAAALPSQAFRTVTWREGTKTPLESRFAAVRVRPAHRDTLRSTARDEEWLLIEWPTGEAAPRKYWLSNLPTSTTREELVKFAQSRWRIERDYQELKDELGLGHYEGRSWRGFHHHATLCIAAYGFLIAERGAFSPVQLSAQPCGNLPYPSISDHEDLPVRVERHVPASIASRRAELIAALAPILTRCPTCLQSRSA